MLEQLVGHDLEAAVDQEPEQRIGPNEPRIAPADRRDEPAIDGRERAEELRSLGRGDELPARPRPLPDRALVAGQIDRQMAGDEELEEDQRLDLGAAEMQVALGDPEEDEATRSRRARRAARRASASAGMSQRTGRSATGALS